MTADALIAQCRNLGVTLAAGPGGKLRVSPPGRLPGDLREQLRRRKAEVLALLTQPSPSWACPHCGGLVHLHPPAEENVPTRFWTCMSCSTWGATREGARFPVVWVSPGGVQ
jgi:hypothetical protein